jgi:adenine-specific DNA-methyltransferase
MNSLLEKEGMAGQVQMIYIDPPYGIRYGSNFQPFVNKRDVKDGKDEDLTQEPETIKAFRDTWELGIHSYLSYLRDRLLLVRELLSETGSLFIQIGDENLHLVRNLLDEIFGSTNFLAVIAFQTKIPLRNKYLPGVCDYLLWYGKGFQGQKTKFRPLFSPQSLANSPQFSLVQMPDGSIRSLGDEERADPSTLPQRAKIFASLDLTSSGRTESCVFDSTWKGKEYSPTAGKSWKTNREGMEALARADRLYATKTALRYKLFLDDYPVKGLTNNWTDTVGVGGKIYVVQTDVKVVARCMLIELPPIGWTVFDLK